MSFSAHKLAQRVPFQQLILTVLVTVMECLPSKIITPRPCRAEICSLHQLQRKWFLVGRTVQHFLCVLFLSVLCPVRLFWKLEKLAGRDGKGGGWGESPPAPKRMTYISDFLLSCTSNIPTAGGDNQTEKPHTTQVLREHLGWMRLAGKGSIGWFLGSSCTRSVMKQTTLPYSAKLKSYELDSGLCCCLPLVCFQLLTTSTHFRQLCHIIT